MPHYSRKLRLLGIAFIAVGAVLAYGWEKSNTFQSMLGWYGGGALIGAGMFLPFGSPWKGALLGLLFHVAFISIVGWFFLV